MGMLKAVGGNATIVCTIDASAAQGIALRWDLES